MNRSNGFGTSGYMRLYDDLYILWRNLLIWVMDYVINVICEFGNGPFIRNRIGEAINDLSAVITEFYGYQNGRIFELLLESHILIIVNYVDNKHYGNEEAAAQNILELQANSLETAEFLEELNPYWPADEGYDLLYNHVAMFDKYTVCAFASEAEAFAELSNTIRSEALLLVDFMTDGLIRQFAL